MTRTNLVLDEVLLEEATRLSGERTYSRTVEPSMHAMPIVESPLRQSVFDEAIDLYRAARRAGISVRSGVDCLIAACAIRHGLTLLHHHRDFPLLARVSSLEVRSI
jgi:predicted nucleic acid-binding protein